MKRLSLAFTIFLLAAHEADAACPVGARMKAAVRRVASAPGRLARTVASPPPFVPVPKVAPKPMVAPAMTGFGFFCPFCR